MLSFLTGIPAAIKSGMMIAVAIAFAALAGYAWIKRGEADAAQAQVASLTAQKAVADRAIAERDAALSEQKRQSDAAIAALQGHVRAMDQTNDRLSHVLETVNAAQTTRACVNSSAIHALLLGMQRPAPAAASGGSGGSAGSAGNAAGLPAGTASPAAGR
jgi:hypothetical protein